jgi:hypothetical protein
MTQHTQQCALVSRKAERFPLDVPVVFWWTDGNGVHEQGEGRCYDLSELGVFVFASACPQEGTHVGLRIPVSQALRMEMEGSVVRIGKVRSGDGRTGFAILSEEIVLRELDKSMREGNSDPSQGEGKTLDISVRRQVL